MYTVILKRIITAKVSPKSLLIHLLRLLAFFRDQTLTTYCSSDDSEAPLLRQSTINKSRAQFRNF